MKEITVQDVFKIIINRILLIVIIPFLAVSVSAYVNYNLVKPTYTAKTTMYVINQQNSESVNYTDLTSGALLLQDYQGLAMSNRVQNAAAAEVGLQSLEAYKISVTSKQNTRLIEISVSGKEPVTTANVANSIATNLSECIKDVMKVENISVIDPAVVPIEPSGPNRVRNTLLAGLVGLAVSIGVALLIEMLNTTIRSAEDVTSTLNIPVLAQVPKITRGLE